MSSEKLTLTPPRKSGWQLPALVVLLGLVWLLVWQQLQALADWLTYDLIGLLPETRLGESINFFLYDVPKILMLLAGMIFLVTFVRSFFSPEQTRAALGGRREGVGLGLAMVRRIVERHGGRVWVEPTPGGGATFKVRLPAG